METHNFLIKILLTHNKHSLSRRITEKNYVSGHLGTWETKYSFFFIKAEFCKVLSKIPQSLNCKALLPLFTSSHSPLAPPQTQFPPLWKIPTVGNRELLFNKNNLKKLLECEFHLHRSLLTVFKLGVFLPSPTSRCGLWASHQAMFLQVQITIFSWQSHKDLISNKLSAYPIILQSCSPTRKSILFKHAFEEENRRPLQCTLRNILWEKKLTFPNPRDLWRLWDSSAASLKVWHVKNSRVLCCLIWLLKWQRFTFWYRRIRNKLEV